MTIKDETARPAAETKSGSLSAAWIADALGLPAPTDEQRAVIEAPLEPALVVAGAGSGKTETMANRVVWLLANRLVEPSQILGLTFTRKAAGELAERIGTRIAQLRHALGTALPGQDSPEERARTMFDAPTVSTYNSFAAGLFAENAAFLGRDADSEILSDASAWQLAMEIVLESTDPALALLDARPQLIAERVVSLSAKMVDNLVEPDSVLAFVDEFEALKDLPRSNPRARSPHIAALVDDVEAVAQLAPLTRLAARFAEEKVARGYLQFADQVALAVQVCRSRPRVAEDYRTRFAVVLLDEYQDTSVMQTELLSTLFPQHPVMAVGDPHQSIYGWRGASAQNLGRFERDFAPAADAPDGAARINHFSLSVSWRNPADVLAAANVVVQPLTAETPFPVQPLAHRSSVVPESTTEPVPTQQSGNASLTVNFSETVDEEADAVARWFSAGLKAGGSESPLTAAMLAYSVGAVRRFTEALARHSVPFQVLGLGDLLEQPVVVDLSSLLAVLVDPTAGSALVRLLAGPQWRVGVKDLDGLATLARELIRRGADGELLHDDVRSRLRASPVAGDDPSIIDALDQLLVLSRRSSPVWRAGFSDEGYARLVRCAAELAELRGRLGGDLVSVIWTVARSTRLYDEVLANANDPQGRAAFAAFLELAEGRNGSFGHTAVRAFLAWLDVAAERDRLAIRTEPAQRGVVQVLTIHGSKGLEWDLVAIPRMVEHEMPRKLTSTKAWLSAGELPFEFLGDAAELPNLRWREARSQEDFIDAKKDFAEQVTARAAAESRRLAYVAITRAKTSLLLTGSWWSTQTTSRGPSPYLVELQGAAVIKGLPEASVFEQNPLDSRESGVLAWPLDGLGTRRPVVEEAAARVAEAAAEAVDGDTEAHTPWDTEIAVLLAERERGADEWVALPDILPASSFKDYVADPVAAALQLRRPLPRRPFRQTGVGIRFHAWVEQRLGGAGYQSELEWDEGPITPVFGADEDSDRELLLVGSVELIRSAELPMDDADHVALRSLQATFEASRWAARKPEHVELAITHSVAGQRWACRIDAVYRDPVTGRYVVVDWKTGGLPRDSEDLFLKRLQLTHYRQAFAAWKDVPLESVDALFYYVEHDTEILAEGAEDQDLGSLWESALGSSDDEKAESTESSEMDLGIASVSFSEESAMYSSSQADE